MMSVGSVSNRQTARLLHHLVHHMCRPHGGNSCVSSVLAKTSYSRASSPSIKTHQRSPKTKATENEDDVVDPGLDHPPVIFVKKYNCLVDVKDLARDESEKKLEENEFTIDQKFIRNEKQKEISQKIMFIQKMASKSTTYGSLVELLREPQEPLFDSPPKPEKSVLDSTIFVDEENIENPSKKTKVLSNGNLNETLQWYESKINPKKLPMHYLMLSKSRLTLLVCSTAAFGYAVAPEPFDVSTFALTTLGVGLVSSSANAINQYMEVPFDSQMNRTKNRVLVRGYLTPLHAMTFATVTAATGTYLLAEYVNGLAASLCLANLVLYTCVYTPVKRISIVNTWIGSVVGAIPPIIGWVGATGSLDYGSLILGGILYAWQFPHFNSLSWNLRPDYSKAGYRMMSVTNPDLCRRVALRYSMGCLAICTAAPMLDVTTWMFAIDSLPLNLYLVYLSWQFHQKSDSSSSRKLFRFTLIHLPLLMTLMLISKKSFYDKKDDKIK